MRIEDVVNFIYTLYGALRSALEYMLKATVYQARPDLAVKFADATTWLVSITAIWLILEFSTGLKKMVRIVVIIGWALLILSMIAVMVAG